MNRLSCVRCTWCSDSRPSPSVLPGSWRTKIVAIVLMSSTLTVSIVFFVEPPRLRAALALMGLVLAVWLYRVPSRDHPD